ncbi:MAG: hypothetical protein LBV02_08900 [Bacteroidales bacterium]|nr:hypothetical protein [Bacteroidales bacterium]
MKGTAKKYRMKKLCLILALLVIPLCHFIKVMPLKGAISIPEKPKFGFHNWFSGEFQEAADQYLKASYGFRGFFVRINNQLGFNFFNKAKANGVIIGEKNYLYEENYIKAYYGTDFIGMDSAAHRIKKLKTISDTLAGYNKNIILIFAAGKGSFYPEFFPNKYKTQKGKTNLEAYKEIVREMQLPYIDFNSYFVAQKNISKHTLYPQYGIHWSYYGMCLAADSIIRYMERLRNINMPHIYWEQIDFAQPKETDYDIADGMNLLFKLKSLEMAYPQVKIQADTNKSKPRVLVVADSYYWGMFNIGISRTFANREFWFYNKEAYSDRFETAKNVEELNLKEELFNYDIIIIMATEATLPNLGWGFIENAYDIVRHKDANLAHQ